MKIPILGLIFLGCAVLNVHAQTDTLIDIGSYKLHIKIIKGKGDPILFESGGGLDAGQWDSISTVLHQKLGATIITYDRQGFGLSGLDTSQYHILNEINGLEFAIKRLGYADSNILLVGHSLGAFYTRLYANRHPNLVKGMIMLDPRIPSKADMKFAKRVFEKLDRNEFSKQELGLYYVLAAMEGNSDFIRKQSIPAKIPVLDIMAEKGPFETNEENERFQSAQRNFIRGRRKASLIYAKSSSHNIHLDKPELVILEISKFYRQYLNQDRVN